MKRRKGVTTIEAMVLTPIILFLFICIIDMAFIVHNRVVAQADLQLIKQIGNDYLAQATDDYLTSSASNWQTGKTAIAVKSQRGIVDMFHLFLDNNAFKERVLKQLQRHNRQQLYQLKQLSINRNVYFFNTQYNLNYDIAIQSPFAFMTNHIFGNYQTLSGSVRLNSYSHLQKMHDIELVFDHLEKLSQLEALIKAIRGVLINCP